MKGDSGAKQRPADSAEMEVLKMIFEMNDEMLEMVSGGHQPLYNDGIPFVREPHEREEHRDGGATGGW